MKHLLFLFLLTGCPPMLADVDAGALPMSVSLKHAHNDYEHARPLADALDQGFQSVEADVWLDGTDVGVSHDGPPFKGSLRSLYLDPLATRVASNGGSVHGDGKPFFLWIDLKDGSDTIQRLLAEQLEGYAFLTRFDDAGVSQQGAVTVLLTGNDRAKKAMVERPAPRPFARDSNSYARSDPPADGKWVAYAVNYFAFMQWPGDGTIPAAQRRQLENLVNGAHATGRTIRLYANPDGEAYWQAAKAAGVDFINTDQLAELAASLR